VYKRQAQQVAALKAHAEGVVVGSRIIEVIEEGGDAVEFVRSLHG